LKKSLNDEKNSLAVKYKKMLGFRRQRGCRQKAPVNYSDDKKPSILNRQETLPVLSPKKKGPKKKGGDSGGQKQGPVLCPNHAGGLEAATRNTKWKSCNDAMIFRERIL